MGITRAVRGTARHRQSRAQVHRGRGSHRKRRAHRQEESCKLDRFDRIYQLHRQLDGRRVPVSAADLMEALECSRATLTRTIGTMRDHLNAPIEYDAQRNGYVYMGDGIPANWELPGLWFSAPELQALLTFERLFSSLSPGLLAEELRPFRERIETLMQNHQIGTGELHERLRILGMGVRGLNPPLFRVVAAALGSRRQLDIDYRSRSRDEYTRRTLSPQRLVYYRDNWYLDAWCHLRKGARIFALDRIIRAEPLADACHHMDDTELDARMASSYGIFQGAARATAVLHFSPRMARWVADERWHAEQRGQWLTDGRYELELPYADPTELIRDVLRYGSDVEVVKPDGLRKLVREELEQALGHYGGKFGGKYGGHDGGHDGGHQAGH